MILIPVLIVPLFYRNQTGFQRAFPVRGSFMGIEEALQLIKAPPCFRCVMVNLEPAELGQQFPDMGGDAFPRRGMHHIGDAEAVRFRPAVVGFHCETLSIFSYVSSST